MRNSRAQRPTLLASYLGIVQFALLLMWTVYAAYLPALLEAVGLPGRWTGWILLADQLLFVCFDVLAGLMAERAFRAYARIGPMVVGVTAVSCIAFALLPLLPRLGAGPTALLAIIGLWAASSAALRSPLFALLARHAPAPEVPKLAGLSLLGMGLAAAISPYLGAQLSAWSPMIPFIMSSAVLLASAAGVIVAERRLGALPATQPTAYSRLPPGLWLPAVLLAALAFQIAAFLDAGPRYLTDAEPTALPWLMPVFWIGFNLMVVFGGKLAQHWGADRLFLAGCLVGAGGIAMTLLPGLEAAIVGFAIAGIGWGSALPSAFGIAAGAGRPDRVAIYTGLMLGAIASAAAVRIALTLSGWQAQPLSSSALAPSALWAAAAAIMAGLIYAARQRKGSAASDCG